MSEVDFDWRYLLRHTMLPAVTLFMAVTVMGASHWMRTAQEQSFARISNDQDLMNADYNALIVEKRLVDRYHLRYERFHEHGFIGEERRLDWIETLRIAAGDLALPTLTYALEPQRKVVPPVASTAGDADIQIYRSELDLEAGLIHEEDLLDLFSALQESAPGVIAVDRCSLERIAQPGALQGVDPNIIAQCSVGMYSIVTSDVPEERVR